MARVITATVAPSRTDALLARLRHQRGVLSLQVSRGISVKEPGDVLVITVTNRQVSAVMRQFDGQVEDRPSSLSIQQPDALYDRTGQREIIRDEIEVPWEESSTFLHRTSQLNLNYLLLMAFSGGLVASGLAMAQLQLILGALLVVPGFSPFLYTGWGLGLGNWRAVRDGLTSALIGYSVLTISAMLIYLLIQLSGQASALRFMDYPLVYEWTRFGLAPVVVTILAAGAGATVAATHRSVLVSGVSLSLALTPAMGIFGIGLVTGHWGLAFRGLGMWAMEGAIIIVVGAALTWAKNRWYIHQRTPWY